MVNDSKSQIKFAANLLFLYSFFSHVNLLPADNAHEI